MSPNSAGTPPGIVWGEPGGDQLLNLGLEMEADLVVQVARRVGAEEVSVPPPGRRLHASAGWVVTLSIAATASA
jgi:hypothetical protein